MADDNNGKVTLAVLANKIDNLTKQVGDLATSVGAVHINQIAIGKLETKLEAQQDEVDNLGNRVNGWSALNSAGIILAAIIGTFVNPNNK